MEGSRDPGGESGLHAPLYLQRLIHGAQVFGPRGIVMEPDVHIDVTDIGYVVESRLPALHHRPLEVHTPDLPFRDQARAAGPGSTRPGTQPPGAACHGRDSASPTWEACGSQDTHSPHSGPWGLGGCCVAQLHQAYPRGVPGHGEGLGDALDELRVIDPCLSGPSCQRAIGRAPTLRPPSAALMGISSAPPA